MIQQPKSMIVGITSQDASYLAEHLLERGDKVYGIHRRSASPNLDRLSNVLHHPNFELICADITDYSSVCGALEKIQPDQIYNMAAMSHVGISFDQPIHSAEVNYIGVVNLLESIRHLMNLSGYNPKMYHASTSEMFGNYVSFVQNGQRFDQKYYPALDELELDLFQDEQTPLKPQSPYAIAKLAAHQMCILYRESYNIQVCCGILFNHSGPRRGENFVEKKICDWVRRFNKEMAQHHFDVQYRGNDGVNIHLYSACEDICFVYPALRLGNLDSKRDLGHAYDYTKAMIKMLDRDPVEEYIICTGKTYSIKDMLTEAFKYTDFNWEDCVVQDPKFMRPAEVPHLRGKNDKAVQELNWTPSISFEEMIKEMVNYDGK